MESFADNGVVATARLDVLQCGWIKAIGSELDLVKKTGVFKGLHGTDLHAVVSGPNAVDVAAEFHDQVTCILGTQLRIPVRGTRVEDLDVRIVFLDFSFEARNAGLAGGAVLHTRQHHNATFAAKRIADCLCTAAA